MSEIPTFEFEKYISGNAKMYISTVLCCVWLRIHVEDTRFRVPKSDILSMGGIKAHRPLVLRRPTEAL